MAKVRVIKIKNFDDEVNECIADAMELKEPYGDINPQELRPMSAEELAKFIDPRVKLIMHFVEWYRNLLKHDIVYLKSKIALLESDHTIDKEHNQQKTLDEILFHNGELNAIKRLEHGLDKDMSAYIMLFMDGDKK